MTTPKRKYQTMRIPSSVAMIAPAVRMLAVEVWAEREAPTEAWTTGHATYPVVAIQATISTHYSRSAEGRGVPVYSPKHSEMEKDGWYTSGPPTVEHVALIVHPEFGLTDPDFACDAVNVDHAVVACPWPPEEDAARLEGIIAEVRERAIKKAQRDERQTQHAAEVAVLAEARR